ncbi:DUF6311 domain-containing protein [Rhodanobacter umsongensis]
MMLSKLPTRWTLLLALLSGLLAFWAWAGAYTLAPGHIGWVMSGLDTQSQYLAWQFFRLGSWWQWPLGANPAYGSDAPGTIVLSDSIPLMALALKPLSSWLNQNFQYFGLWAVACFLLQGWFGCKLMQRLTHDPVAQLAGTVFFLTASIFLFRVYMHPALAAQWLLLAGFCLVLGKEFRARVWLSLLSIAILVHVYLFIMLAALWAADLMQRRWRRECGLLQLLMHAAIAVTLVTMLMWMVGYFVPASTLAMTIRTRLDLWFPFWTGYSLVGEWSWFMPSSNLDMLAFDGFGYFGLGFLLLLPIALVSSMVNRWRGSIKVAGDSSIPVSSWFVLAGVCLLLFIYALGNHVYFAQQQLFAYPLPDWLDRVYSIFRGAARMMWPMWYFLLIGALFMLIRGLGARHARWVLCLCVVMQLGDLSRAAVNIRHATTAAQGMSGMGSPLWNELAAGHRHVVYLQPANVPAGMLSYVKSYRRVANYAATHGLTINIAYLAREDTPRLALASSARVDLLMQGQAERSTFYVVADGSLWAKLVCIRDSKQWYGVVDGLRLVVPDPSPTLRAIPRVPCANLDG